MEVYDDTEVVIVCPAYEKSGGPFALHQLAHELRKRKIDSWEMCCLGSCTMVLGIWKSTDTRF